MAPVRFLGLVALVSLSGIACKKESMVSDVKQQGGPLDRSLAVTVSCKLNNLLGITIDGGRQSIELRDSANMDSPPQFLKASGFNNDGTCRWCFGFSVQPGEKSGFTAGQILFEGLFLTKNGKSITGEGEEPPRCREGKIPALESFDKNTNLNQASISCELNRTDRVYFFHNKDFSKSAIAFETLGQPPKFFENQKLLRGNCSNCVRFENLEDLNRSQLPFDSGEVGLSLALQKGSSAWETKDDLGQSFPCSGQGE